MKSAPVLTLRQVLRGEEPGEIQLVANDGSVLIVCAHGLTRDEKGRTREAVVRLLSAGPGPVH